MKRKMLNLGLILFLVLFALIIIIQIYNRKKTVDSYNEIPLGNGQINWGMSTDELIGILGDPTSMASDEFQDTLTYDTTISSELGSCSSLVLYVGKKGDEVTHDTNDFEKPGLGLIEMIIEDTTKEKVVKSLNKIYGELVIQNTEMEIALQKSKPEYFNKRLYTEKWYAGELPNDTYSQLEKIYLSSPGDMVMDKKSLLFNVIVSGVEDGKSYSCKVQLNGVLLSYLKMLQS